MAISWTEIQKSILIHAYSIKLTQKDLPKWKHKADNCGFCIEHHISEKRLEELQNEETQTDALKAIKEAIY